MELEIQLLRFGWGKTPFLELEGVRFQRGCSYALLGANGSGKTTLLKILSGLLPVGASPQRQARLLYDGEPVGYRFLRQRGVYLHQEPYLLSGTVFTNVAWGLTLQKHSAVVIARKVAAVLESLGLGDLANRRTDQLSGGEARRTALARALVIEPQFLFLDEPDAGQDQVALPRVTEALANAARAGALVVASGHSTSFLNSARQLVLPDPRERTR